MRRPAHEEDEERKKKQTLDFSVPFKNGYISLRCEKKTTQRNNNMVRPGVVPPSSAAALDSPAKGDKAAATKVKRVESAAYKDATSKIKDNLKERKLLERRHANLLRHRRLLKRQKIAGNFSMATRVPGAYLRKHVRATLQATAAELIGTKLQLKGDSHIHKTAFETLRDSVQSNLQGLTGLCAAMMRAMRIKTLTPEVVSAALHLPAWRSPVIDTTCDTRRAAVRDPKTGAWTHSRKTFQENASFVAPIVDDHIVRITEELETIERDVALLVAERNTQREIRAHEKPVESE
jgi:hypothetical protein